MRHRGGRFRRGVKYRVLAQHGVVQATELGTGLDADLLHEHAARIAIGGQRLSLPSGAVEREHALDVQPLLERMSRDERFELPDHLQVPSADEVLVDGQLAGAKPQLLEPADLGSRERLADDVGQSVAAPEGERFARRSVRAAAARGVDEALEPLRIDVLCGESQLVAATARQDLRGVAGQRLAELGDVELDHLRRAVRWLGAPQPFNQPIDGDGPVHLEREHGQDGALLRGAQRDRTAVEGRLDRAQELEV